MKKVGILGGTFNPPHIGHCIIANEVLHALKLDEVRLMPNAIAPHKVVENSPSNAQRQKMIELAIDHVPSLRVEPFELLRGGVSYTYDTMAELTAREPDVQFYFIIGGDSIDSLHTWYKINELQKLVTFVGVKRPGYSAQSAYNVQMVDLPEIALSSSFVRSRLERGETVQYLLPKQVEQYIREERLYESRA